MPAVLGLAALALGLVCILADHHVGRAVRRTAEPEAGAATARILGLILLVGGGLAFLAWMP